MCLWGNEKLENCAIAGDSIPLLLFIEELVEIGDDIASLPAALDLCLSDERQCNESRRYHELEHPACHLAPPLSAGSGKRGGVAHPRLTGTDKRVLCQSPFRSFVRSGTLSIVMAIGCISKVDTAEHFRKGSRVSHFRGTAVNAARSHVRAATAANTSSSLG